MSAEQLKSLSEQAKAWPFAEARALQDRLAKLTGDDPDRPVLFETGYGPSGLPHIGTFGEVVRTSMVRHAFECLTGRKTRLICFSDDMDGLRKVPDNVPNPDKIEGYLQMPLTKVPDPFGTHPLSGPITMPACRPFWTASVLITNLSAQPTCTPQASLTQPCLIFWPLMRR